jgi:tRNA (adenine57-N1/adenine58-N1)-methyltransferase
VKHFCLKVLESGIGCGTLTATLAQAVAPVGAVHTFEFHAGRQQQAALF